MAGTPIGRILLMPRGAYSGTAVYNNLDWVRHNGVAWVCTTDNTTGIAPATGVPEWQVLAQDGAVTGSVDWSNVNYKPFNSIKSGGGLKVNVSNELELDISMLTGSNISYDNTTSGLTASDVQAALDEIAGSSTDVSWNQIQSSTGATKIAEISIDGTSTDVYAPTGGGGSSTLSGLSDVNLTSPSNNEILKYNSTTSKWENGTGGGHNMISNTPESTLLTSISTALTTDDNVVSAYGIKTWSNADTMTLWTTVPQGDDTVGQWDDDWTTAPVDRTGWLWHSALHGILSDSTVEVEVVFDVADSEVVSCYAYRIDDNVQNGGVDGGAIALKLNGAIQNASGVKVGINLKRQRTQVSNFTVLT